MWFTMNVILINYGVGNIFSVEYALRRAYLNVEVCSSLNSFGKADAIVIPGVGNFKIGAENLGGFKGNIIDLVRSNIPILGICLGMQLFFQESDECPNMKGLGLLNGRVARLPRNVKTPHIGWNNLKIVKYTQFLDGVDEGDYFYFAHSYYAVPSNPEITAAETEYGVRFTSVIVKNNVFGVQFHPEKSGKSGEKIIRNFARIIKR
ncbi:MAG: imidazole glycerol phosphate synthase subunit HisH [Candidatus Methanomethylicia archaeon]